MINRTRLLKLLLVVRQVLQPKKVNQKQQQLLHQLQNKTQVLLEQSSNSGTQGQETKKTDNSKQSQDKQPTLGNNSQATSNQPAQASQSSQTAKSSYDPTTDRKLHDKQAEHNKRYKGVLTMVDGDFSAAAGNWKGGNGETITVSSGGQFTVETADGKKESYSVQGYSYTLDDGKYNAKVGGGKIIQITTGADGAVSNVALVQP